MKTKVKSDTDKKRRGAPLKGAKHRERYNVTLDPDLVSAGKKLAVTKDQSFSELLENGLKQQLNGR